MTYLVSTPSRNNHKKATSTAPISSETKLSGALKQKYKQIAQMYNFQVFLCGWCLKFVLQDNL